MRSTLLWTLRWLSLVLACCEETNTVKLGVLLPFRAGLSEAERHALQGLELLAEKVNQSRIFLGEGGPLRLSLQVKDDGGHPARAKELYKDMVESGEVTALMGLQSSVAAQVSLAEASNSTGVLGILAGGLPLSDLIQDGRHLITTDVLAEDYMREALELVKLQSPPVTSVAMVWDVDSELESKICLGAMRHAESSGLKVLSKHGRTEEAIMPQMRRLQVLGPDLLVVCSGPRVAEEVIVAAFSLGFNPLGLIFTAASEQFAADVGPHLANYVLTPTTWNSTSSHACRVFGSALHFADEYKQHFQEPPRPESVAAAAGAILLLSAVEKTIQSSLASSLNRTWIQEAAFHVDVETSYGRISVSSDGSRGDAKTLIQQVVPIDEGTLAERWTRSALVTLGPDGTPRWPMPSWVQKEVDIYPCSPGEAFVLDHDHNGTTLADSSCEKCPAGRARAPDSVVCEDCEPGLFSLDAGMSQCQVCPSGGYCPGGVTPGGPEALPGYYRLQPPSTWEKEPKIVLCSPASICLGRNTCGDSRTGLLCRECAPGYTLPRFGLQRDTCMKCPERRWSLWTIATTVLLYVLYIWLIVKGTLSASTSIRAIHSVVLKICVNYLQFAGTAFEATNFKEMLVSIFGGNATWLIPMVMLPERMQYPLTSLISVDCLLHDVDIREYQVQILLGLSLMPVAFFLMTVLAMVRKDGADCIRMRLLPLRCSRARKRRRQSDPELAVIDEAGEIDSPCKSARHLPLPTASPKETPKSPGKDHLSPSPAARGDECTPRRSCKSMSSLSIMEPTPTHREESVQHKSSHKSQTQVFVNSMATRFVNSVIVMSFILHPVVVRMLVVGFECEELDVLRHRLDLDVPCRSPEHMHWLSLSTAGLLLYGLGTPASLFFALFRVRRRLLRTEVRKRYGFLYNGFELKYYYFESVYMFRKVMILLFFTSPTMYVRMVLLLFTSFAFILLHIRTQPFDNRSYLCLDRLEALNLGALFVTVSARLIFDLRQELSGQFFEDLAKHWIVDIVIVVAPLVSHASFIAFAVWSLFRNIVLKHLALKAEIWPEKMSLLQSFILRLDRQKSKATFDEDERGLCIDTSQLSKKEQDFLFVALCDTLHRYMDSCQRVHPGDITAAVQEAVVRCRRARRRRAVALELLARQRSDRSCLSRLLGWQGEVQLSLHGAHKPEGPQTESESSCLGDFIRWLSGGREKASEHLPEKALHLEMEKSREFSAEEFFDALMPVWQEITEGFGPQLSPRHGHLMAASAPAAVSGDLEQVTEQLNAGEDIESNGRGETWKEDELLAEVLQLRQENQVLHKRCESCNEAVSSPQSRGSHGVSPRTTAQPQLATVPSGGRLLLPLPSVADRAKSFAQEAGSASHGSRSDVGSPSPWSRAMRPANPRAWKHASDREAEMPSLEFDFRGAARPTRPDAWPQRCSRMHSPS